MHGSVRVYEFCKRLMDVLGASAGLIIISPLMLVVAIAVKLDSPGPVFFRQTRLGRNGKPFTFLKFRSMQANADRLQAALMKRNGVSGPVFKIRSDPRITRVGRFIRRYSLDEVPQLWHVLVGQMSLVGPRPPLPHEVAHYEPWQTERLAAKPGLTCTWQVSGRSNIPFDRWVEMDIEYVRRANLLQDLRLLALTIPAVLSARGAY